MDIKELRSQELQKQKDERRMHIVQSALGVLLDKGIESATMNDVAQHAQVGVATVFRYFETKKQLVIEVAEYLWTSEGSLLDESIAKQDLMDVGINQVKSILVLFKEVYQRKPHIFRFLEQFDNFVLKEQIEVEELTNYEHRILAMKQPFYESFDRGIHDGSIRTDLSKEIIYMTYTHQMMSLISKLVLRGSVLRSDQEISAETQIDLVIDMMIEYLRLK